MQEDLGRYGGWALITGAATGLGKAFAQEIAAAGVSCVLVGLDGDRLRDVAQDLEETHGVSCRYLELDLTTSDALDRIAALTADIPIGLLVNNAGIACGGAFATRSPEVLRRTVELNCLVPVSLTRAFLPPMLERDRGGIIVVSSLMAFLSAPQEATYCATKAFGLHFGEALWGELRGTGVDVITVCPGGMRTEFFAKDGVRADDCARLMKVSAPPERIARLTLRNLGRKPTVTPIGAFLLRSLTRFAPRRTAIWIVDQIMGRLARFT